MVRASGKKRTIPSESPPTCQPVQLMAWFVLTSAWPLYNITLIIPPCLMSRFAASMLSSVSSSLVVIDLSPPGNQPRLYLPWRVIQRSPRTQTIADESVWTTDISYFIAAKKRLVDLKRSQTCDSKEQNSRQNTPSRSLPPSTPTSSCNTLRYNTSSTHTTS